MSTKLNKVVKELNVGLATAVEFLHKKGFADVESNPNARITEEQYDLLVKEFSKDKSQKIESGILAQRSKERPKGEVVAPEGFDKENKPVEEIKVEIQETSRPQFKQVGKIDLDALVPKKKDTNEVKEEMPNIDVPLQENVEEIVTVQQVEQAPIQEVEEEITEPSVVVEAEIEDQSETENVVEDIDESVDDTISAELSDDVYTIEKNTIHSTINVVGKIDLDALNQQTRPKKKTKEEKKKERLEREIQ